MFACGCVVTLRVCLRADISLASATTVAVLRMTRIAGAFCRSCRTSTAPLSWCVAIRGRVRVQWVCEWLGQSRALLVRWYCRLPTGTAFRARGSTMRPQTRTTRCGGAARARRRAWKCTGWRSCVSCDGGQGYLDYIKGLPLNEVRAYR